MRTRPEDDYGAGMWISFGLMVAAAPFAFPRVLGLIGAVMNIPHAISRWPL